MADNDEPRAPTGERAHAFGLDNVATASEADYRTLANALPQIIWTCDAQGRLEWLNDRWVELTGMGREQSLEDTGALPAIHPDDRAGIQQRFSEALASGTPCEFEYRIRTRHGAYRYHLSRVTPVRDDAGRITRWVAAAFDIHERREAEEALRSSNHRFEAIFHLNPQPTVVTRISDGTFLDANDAFLRLSGFSRREVIGSNPVALGIWNQEQRTSIVQTLRDTRGSIAVACRAKSGESMTLQMSAAPIDVGGDRCLITVATDISDRLATDAMLRESEAQARARADELAVLMDAVPAIVLIASDPDGRDVRVNRAGYELLRTKPGQNISKTADDASASRHFSVRVGHQTVQPEDLPLQRAARGIEIRDCDEQIEFDDGQVVHLYGSAVPLRDAGGAPRGSIGAFVDVTRLKTAEDALREADRRKDEFLALLSHELRNPLAPILTAAQLMQLRGDVATPREREVILRQAQHLARLVDDLLDVSRVARGMVTLTTKPLQIGVVVARAVEAVTPLFEQRQHLLAVAVPSEGLPIEADEVRLTQVVSNLLTNAARYTPVGGRIDVTASREGEDVVLRVRDNGIGIEASLLPHVFDLFVQGAPGVDRSQGGLGLGLSLARRLTALHGGTITAHSDGSDSGSEFVVRLPVSSTVAQVRPALERLAATHAGVRRRRILVVDDNRDGAEMIANLLTAAGNEVRIAHDPSLALVTAATFRPEVAILDIGLPVMDGYALGRELRSTLESPPVLIALTGYGQDQDRLKSQEAGFTAHLIKPVASDALIAVLRTLEAERQT